LVSSGVPNPGVSTKTHETLFESYRNSLVKDALGVPVPECSFFFEAIRVSLHIVRMQMRLTSSSRTTIKLTMPNNNNKLVIPNNN